MIHNINKIVFVHSIRFYNWKLILLLLICVYDFCITKIRALLVKLAIRAN